MNSFDPNNLNRFLMDCAGQAYRESDTNFNAGMAHLMACVKKYFNIKDFDIPIRDNNGWVATDDELPKPFEKVLVYVKTPKKVIIDTDSHNPELLEYGVRHSFVATKYEVTHWQPLPQPPKE